MSEKGFRYRSVGGFRLIRTLAVLKWVGVAAVLLNGAVTVYAIETATLWPRATEVLAVLGTALLAVAVWAAVGIWQHHLSMLAVIVDNTTPAAMEPPPSPEYAELYPPSGRLPEAH